MKPVRTTTDSYDATGIGTFRLLRIVILWKLLGLADLGRKQRISPLLGIWIRQRFGRQFAWITVKHERSWMSFLRTFRHRRSVLIRRAGLIRDKLLGRL
jgi:hypothetical protein